MIAGARFARFAENRMSRAQFCGRLSVQSTGRDLRRGTRKEPGMIENGLAGVPFDHPREACGVFGIVAPGLDVARITYFGLYALQHRGQESAGIAAASGMYGTSLRLHTRMG